MWSDTATCNLLRPKIAKSHLKVTSTIGTPGDYLCDVIDRLYCSIDSPRSETALCIIILLYRRYIPYFTAYLDVCVGKSMLSYI